jgi:hypothetical protein
MRLQVFPCQCDGHVPLLHAWHYRESELLLIHVPILALVRWKFGQESLLEIAMKKVLALER